jgi:hypothetical protein
MILEHFIYIGLTSILVLCVNYFNDPTVASEADELVNKKGGIFNH